MQKKDYINQIEKLLPELPDYVNDYYHAKRSIPLSLTTLYHYLSTFQQFFDWMRTTKVTGAVNNRDITLSDLENLSLTDAQLYKEYQLNRPRLNTKKENNGLSKSSINPSLSALKSLFKYLSSESEGINGKTLIARNVMEKIPLVKDGRTLQTRARTIGKKLLINGEAQVFLDFVDKEYAKKITAHQLAYFKVNKVRDLAIIALFLASGVRLSELCNLNLSDLHLDDEVPSIKVIRKGDVEDDVLLRIRFLHYIQDYLNQRPTLYPGSDNLDAVFVTARAGKVTRINTSTVETLVKRYSAAYGKPFSPHKLRHSIATDLYEKSGHDTQMVQTQLGQKSPNATQLYMHVSETRQENILKDL